MFLKVLDMVRVYFFTIIMMNLLSYTIVYKVVSIYKVCFPGRKEVVKEYSVPLSNDFWLRVNISL